jgi:hypothetical protein
MFSENQTMPKLRAALVALSLVAPSAVRADQKLPPDLPVVVATPSTIPDAPPPGPWDLGDPEGEPIRWRLLHPAEPRTYGYWALERTTSDLLENEPAPEASLSVRILDTEPRCELDRFASSILGDRPWWSTGDPASTDESALPRRFTTLMPEADRRSPGDTVGRRLIAEFGRFDMHSEIGRPTHARPATGLLRQSRRGVVYRWIPSDYVFVPYGSPLRLFREAANGRNDPLYVVEIAAGEATAPSVGGSHVQLQYAGAGTWRVDRNGSGPRDESPSAKIDFTGFRLEAVLVRFRLEGPVVNYNTDSSYPANWDD